MLTDFINQQSQNQTNLKLELNSTLVNPLHDELKMQMPLKDQYQTVQAKSEKFSKAAAAPNVQTNENTSTSLIVQESKKSE